MRKPFEIILVCPPRGTGRRPQGLWITVSSPEEIGPTLARVEELAGPRRAQDLRRQLEEHFGLAGEDHPTEDSVGPLARQS